MSRLIITYILLSLLGSDASSSQFIPSKEDLKSSLGTIQLKEEMNRLFNSDEAKGIFWGVDVVRLKDRQELFSLNRNKRFRPASNMKSIIASAALKALSADFQFDTKLFIDGKIVNGVLKGNLIVVGSGDPTFKSEAFLNWYEALKKYKIERITGDVIGIDSIFDDQKLGLLWSWDDLSNCYSAQISGLQINNNCVELRVSAAEQGRHATIKKFPDTSYVKTYNNTKATEGRSSLKFKREENSNNIIIEGELSKNTPEINKWVSVNNPTLYFSTLLYEGLSANGFVVNGKPRDARDIGYVLNRNKAYQIANHKSPTLRAIINDFLKYSINLYGESILKTLGFVYFNEGTTYNGRLAVNLIFKQFNLPEDTLFIADGSGLSGLNLISPEYMTSLLYSMSRSYQYHSFFDALSVSGMDGTLRKRLTSEYLKGAIHAKTGYIRNVRTLSGYIDTFGNDRVAFAVFANNYDNKLDKAESVINKACAIMRLYNTSKDPASLGDSNGL